MFEWMDALKGITPEAIEKALFFCKLNLIWPPSIAEFISICELSEGLPTLEQTYQGALRKEYSHEIIQRVRNAVGSWAFQNDSEKILREKVKQEYENQVKRLRMEKNKLYEKTVTEK